MHVLVCVHDGCDVEIIAASKDRNLLESMIEDYKEHETYKCSAFYIKFTKETYKGD